MSENTDPQVEPVAIDRTEEKLEDAGFSSEEIERRRQALTQVRQFGDPVLRTEARVIETFDSTIVAQAEKMIGLMQDAYGIGLAAPQIGTSNRLFVYRVGSTPPIVLANPVIEWSSDDEETFEEGCLSLTNVNVDVDRPIYVLVKGKDANGDDIRIEASGLEARVIQHELDHLDGILILDRASKDQRREALAALRDAEQNSGYAA